MALSIRQIKRKDYLERAIDAIYAAQEGALAGQAAEMTFNGRSITRFDMAELDAMQRRYERELQKLERINEGKTIGNTLRFYG